VASWQCRPKIRNENRLIIKYICHQHHNTIINTYSDAIISIVGSDKSQNIRMRKRLSVVKFNFTLPRVLLFRVEFLDSYELCLVLAFVYSPVSALRQP